MASTKYEATKYVIQTNNISWYFYFCSACAQSNHTRFQEKSDTKLSTFNKTKIIKISDCLNDQKVVLQRLNKRQKTRFAPPQRRPWQLLLGEAAIVVVLLLSLPGTRPDNAHPPQLKTIYRVVRWVERDSAR